MRKKRIQSITMVFFALVCFISMVIGIVNFKKANAAVIKEVVYKDNFNSEELNSNWIAKDANLLSDYHALRVQPEKNDWATHIICRGYKMEGDCRLVMTTQQLPTNEVAWFALSFGSFSSSGIFEKASGAFVFFEGRTTLFKNGASTNKTFMFSPLGGAFKTKVATTIIEFEKRDDGDYNITFIVTDGEKIVGQDVIEDFEVENGYFGFNTYSTHFDVLSFDVFENDEMVYEDDFSSSSISHNNNVVRNSEWVALSPFTVDTANIQPVGKLDVSKIGSEVTFAEPFVKKSNELATLYELSAKFDFSSATVGVATGFEIAKQSAEEDGTFIGIVRDFESCKIVCSSGQNVEEREIKQPPADSTFNLSLVAYYDNSIVININGQEERFLATGVEGYWGLKTPTNYATSGNGAFVDDVSFERFINKEISTADTSINFEGVKEFEDEYGKYYQYYISAKDWYIGSNVRVANYDFSDNGYVLFGNASPTSSFAPKVRYNDCIVRFDVTMVGTDYYYDKPESYYETYDGRGSCEAECFGLQFGLDSYQTIYDNAVSLGIATYSFGTEDNKQAKSVYYATNCTGMLNPSQLVYRPNMETIPANEYDLFRKSVTYNFMYIIRNGTVSMHFKESTEPESVLGIVREYVTGVKTEGYIAVYGANGVDFRMDNFSVVSLERSITSSAYLGGENIETFRTDVTKGDTLKAFTQKQSGLETKGVIENHIARFTIENTNGLEYRHGNLSIVFAENGATIKDGVKTEEISFNKALNCIGATIEISRIGDELTIAFANAEAPLSDIDENVYVVKGLALAERTKVEILGGSKISLTKVALFNLDSMVTITSRDFNAETDIIDPWKVKESIQGEDGGFNWLIVVLIVAPIVLCSAVVVVVLILVKKRRKNAK